MAESSGLGAQKANRRLVEALSASRRTRAMRLQIGNFPRRLDLEARLVIGGGLGFRSSGLGMQEMEEYLQTHTVSELKHLFEHNQIALANVWPGPLYWDEGDVWEQVFQVAERRCGIVAQLGGTQVGINTPSRWPKEPTEYEWNWLVEKYRRYADMLGQYKLNLVIEYLGPHCERPLRRVNYSFIDNLVAALQLVERIGRPNVGLIVDVMHWWSGGSTYEDLHKVSGLPLAVHFFDIMQDVTRETVNDWDRVLPGKGMIDLVRFLRILKGDGFDGDVMPELLRREDLAEADSWEGPKLIRDAYFAILDQV
jgi:sugar phosphate isomerase/epimerase